MVLSNQTYFMHLTLAFALSCLFVAQEAQAAPPPNSGNQKKIVKWVDEKGVTHYGDRLPAQDASRNSSLLNKQGVKVEERNPLAEHKGAVERQQLDQALLEQQRKDNALLSTYSSEVEIDIARDRNLQMDELAMQGLKQSEKNALAAKAETLAYIEKLKKNKRPVPSDVQQELQERDAKILDVRDKIAKMNKLMDDKRQKYAADKQRFAEIKPKAMNLQDVQKKEVYLKELKEWKLAAEEKIGRIQKEMLLAKRSGKAVDDTVTAKLTNAQAEVARADEEIRTTERVISEMRASLSGAKATTAN